MTQGNKKKRFRKVINYEREPLIYAVFSFFLSAGFFFGGIFTILAYQTTSEINQAVQGTFICGLLILFFSSFLFWLSRIEEYEEIKNGKKGGNC
jgi:hypothetical protein